MRNFKLLFLMFVVLIVSACNEEPSNTQPEEAAEAKLRSRVEAWYGKNDRPGVNGGQCGISCHTTIPFMLMNPMESLEDRVTAHDFRQLVAARVANWTVLEPLYSWAEEDSRSTEALLNVVSLLEYDRKVHKILSGPTCKALGDLWPLQQNDGSFLWLDAGLSPWEDEHAPYFASAMLALSLARVSKLVNTSRGWASCEQWDEQTDNVTALHAYLKSNYTKANKHGRLWFYWANQELDFSIMLSRDHIAHVTNLFSLQRDDGGFDLKDFGPFAQNADSPAMSQPYVTGLILNSLGDIDLGKSSLSQRFLKAKAFMDAYQYSDIDSLRSLNKPESDWNNGLFQDANLAFYLGMRLSE